MKKNLLKIYFLFIATPFLTSCEHEDTLVEDNITFTNDKVQVTDDKIQLTDGYLSISSEEYFNSITEKTNPYEKIEYDTDGFTSLMSIFLEAVDEDEKYFEEIESYSDKELNKLFPNGVNPHSDFVNKNSHLFKFHPEGWFELKIADIRMAKFVNLEGIVKIGETYKKYTENTALLAKDLNLLKLTNKSKGVTIHTYEKFRIEHSDTEEKIISSPFQVNNCTNRKDRYRVRLYEDIVVENRGVGNYEMKHFFNVHSFRHTVQGWQRRFKTGSLAGRVDYQASYGSGGEFIEANGKQHSIGWVLVSSVLFTDYNRPEIYYSSGEGWGRNGCHCTYEKSY